MEQEFITDQPLPEDISNGGEAAGSAGIKDILSKELGKEFPTDEAAIKAVKDTFSYVGKAGQEKATLEKQLQELQGRVGDNQQFSKEITDIKNQIVEDKFYSENPEYKPYAATIRRLGNNPAEVVVSEEFKPLFEKAKAHDQIEKSKSVLQSSPRLGQVRDKMSQAKEALSQGNMSDAKQSAVSAVIDAYEL